MAEKPAKLGAPLKGEDPLIERLTFRVSKPMRRRIKSIAKKKFGDDEAELIRDALDQYLARNIDG